MGRPGFVLEVDERTPPLLVPDGDRFRLERFPLGTRVIYPAESLSPVPGLVEAINAALDTPIQSEPLSALLEPATRLTIAFDDIGTPTPRMRRTDIRGKVIEAVLTRAAAAGVDDVALVSANGLDRRMTAEELQHIVGERVFRSFYADGLLTNHDAEDAENLAKIGSTEAGEIAMNARAADSDLLIFVHLVVTPPAGGTAAIAAGLGSTATIGQLSGLRAQGRNAAASPLHAARIGLVTESTLYGVCAPTPITPTSAGVDTSTSCCAVIWARLASCTAAGAPAVTRVAW